jgi:hypothetical protein
VSRSIHRLAELDVAAAVKFYRQEAGIGIARRFLSEFERTALLLAKFRH